MFLVIFLFLILLIGIILGFPIAISLGIATLVGLLIGDFSLLSISIRMFSGLNSYELLALPFFIILGMSMNISGITNRIINLSNSLVGNVKASLAQINILASLFMAGVSGSDMADVSSIGVLLIPAMKENGYTKEEAAIITGTSSSIGPIFPPSITMVIYGAFTMTPIFGLFMAGVIPGLLLAVALMFITYFLSIKRPNSMGNPCYKVKKISFKETREALKDCAAALPIPVIIIGGIYGGFVTVTEAAIVSSLYSVFIGMFVYKTLNYKMIKKVLLDSALTTSLVGTVVALAYTFSYMLSVQGFARSIMDLFASLSDFPLLMIGILLLIFFLLGCFIPITVILIIFSPFFTSLIALTGLERYQFAMIVLLSLQLGVMTPPYGTILYVVCHIADTTVFKCIPTLAIYLLPLVIVIILVVFFPFITTFIPSLL